jgi:hypothetical protein
MPNVPMSERKLHASPCSKKTLERSCMSGPIPPISPATARTAARRAYNVSRDFSDAIGQDVALDDHLICTRPVRFQLVCLRDERVREVEPNDLVKASCLHTAILLAKRSCCCHSTPCLWADERSRISTSAHALSVDKGSCSVLFDPAESWFGAHVHPTRLHVAVRPTGLAGIRVLSLADGTRRA